MLSHILFPPSFALHLISNYTQIFPPKKSFLITKTNNWAFTIIATWLKAFYQ